MYLKEMKKNTKMQITNGDAQMWERSWMIYINDWRKQMTIWYLKYTLIIDDNAQVWGSAGWHPVGRHCSSLCPGINVIGIMII